MAQRRSLIVTVLALAWGISLAPHPVSRAADECLTFPETGKAVCAPFLAYWQSNGGLVQQGYPLTDAFDEVNPTDGRTYRSQYFERSRFEYHPENTPPYDVLLGLLGREQFLLRYPQGRPASGSGEQCFPETGYCLGGRFLEYWLLHGGLAQQGLPISDEFDEVSPTDGRTYRVQYLERGRFEWHPENAAPFDVLLGLVGREQYLQRYPNGLPPNSAWGPTLTPLPGGTSYTDPAVRFALRVPEDWTRSSATDGLQFVAPERSATLTVRLDSVPANVTLDDVDPVLEAGLTTLPDYAPTGRDRVVVDGVLAYRRILRCSSGGNVFQMQLVYLVAQDTLHRLTFVTSPASFAQFAPTFDGIAGTYQIGARTAPPPQLPPIPPVSCNPS